MTTSILTLPLIFILRARSENVGLTRDLTLRLPSSVEDCCASAIPPANKAVTTTASDFLPHENPIFERPPRRGGSVPQRRKASRLPVFQNGSAVRARCVHGAKYKR